MHQPLPVLIDQLPTRWVRRFVAAFEAGRVQKHPHARFVNNSGECCLVGALAGVRTSSEFAESELAAEFLGGPLEALSRGFEARHYTAQGFYEEALLALTARAAQPGFATSVATEPTVRSAAFAGV
jgi:hypothetical protein